jgi:hypothetical protein
LNRINYSVNINERLADRLRDRARRDGVPMRALVDQACFGEIALGEIVLGESPFKYDRKPERPGDCAREMFRLARPEVPR